MITWHCKHNYGSVLQTLALQWILTKYCGVDVEIIDFTQNWAERVSDRAVHLLYEPVIWTKDRYRRAREAWLDDINERYSLFETFIKTHLRLSKRYTYLNALVADPPKYDLYISGSDQIWNLLLGHGNLLLPYFLCFSHSPNKIAYGCGMNKDAKEPFTIGFKYLPLLRAYKRIMVREKWAAISLERYLNKTIDVVLDPTLLLHPSDYQPYIRKPRADVKTPYIFAYFLMIADNERLARQLCKLAKQTGKKIVLVSSDLPINNEYITTLTGVGPSEWLWLIQNAEAVITSSFHGMAYAALFNKPFFTIGKDSRKQSLLDILQLSKCMIDTMEELPQNFAMWELDYSNANMRLDRERDRCKNLLHDAVDMCKIGDIYDKNHR